jgi:hypothetical protein
VVYADRITRTETSDKGEEIAREIPFLKAYSVFNAEQIDNLPPHFTALAAPTLDPMQRIAHAESFFAAAGADIRHGGNQAYYVPSRDFVQMPPFETFRDAEAFYQTFSHEICHWTRHEKRLHRDFGRKCWGDEGYAAEELVAELGSAFLCADLGLTPEPRADHASYIENWLRVLKNDKRAIFTAAGYAEAAAAFLHGLQPKTETATSPAAATTPRTSKSRASLPNARTFRSPKPDTAPTSLRRTPLPPTAAPSPSSKHGSKPRVRPPTGAARNSNAGSYCCSEAEHFYTLGNQTFLSRFSIIFSIIHDAANMALGIADKSLTIRQVTYLSLRP